MFGVVKSGSVRSVSFGGKDESGRPYHEDEDSDFLRDRKDRSPSRWSLIAFLIALGLLIVLSLFNVAAIVRQLTTKPRYEAPQAEFVDISLRPKKPLVSQSYDTEALGVWDCGRTVESAIANGCPFDVVSNLWIPPRCYNSTFALEALHGVEVGTEHGGIGAPEFGLGDWEWYEDEELSRRIHNVEGLLSFLAKRDKEGLPLDAFTHMSFHAAHCSYLARVATDGLHRVHMGEVRTEPLTIAFTATTNLLSTA